MLPVDMLGIGRILQNTSEPEERRIARVKSYVLEQLAIKNVGGRTVLMEVSGETFTYDDSESAAWQISTLTTMVQGDGGTTTSAVMRQPLGAWPLSCGAFLPYPEHILSTAWESHDDKLCIPRQLAQLFGITLDDAISLFDEFLIPGWREIGVTPLELKELCRRQGRSFYFVSGHRLLDNYEPLKKTDPCVASH